MSKHGTHGIILDAVTCRTHTIAVPDLHYSLLHTFDGNALELLVSFRTDISK